MDKCKCGAKIDNANSFNMIENLVFTVTECNQCGRRIHRTFSLSLYSIHKDGNLEELESVRGL